jgi:hypothetical protein
MAAGIISLRTRATTVAKTMKTKTGCSRLSQEPRNRLSLSTGTTIKLPIMIGLYVNLRIVAIMTLTAASAQAATRITQIAVPLTCHLRSCLSSSLK